MVGSAQVVRAEEKKKLKKAINSTSLRVLGRWKTIMLDVLRRMIKDECFKLDYSDVKRCLKLVDCSWRRV